MNLTSLDANLRCLTKSEEKYKQGYKTKFWDSLPKLNRNGLIICKNDFSGTNDTLTAGSLHVKKHSRFQTCPLHIHEWVEINYMYSGACPQRINDETYVLKEGQVILIDTDTPHSTEGIGENDIMISILINKPYLNTIFFNRLSKDSILSQFFINSINQKTSHNNFILFHSEKSRRIPIFFKEFLCEYYDPSLNTNDIINSLFNLILSELINVYENDMEKARLKVTKNSVIPILRYIEGNYKTCTLKSTAKFFNMNPNYLTTFLKQHTNRSFKELVQEKRITYAAKLLSNTEMPVTEIANYVGYENVSFFYKKFKEAYHCSPKEYRTQPV